MAGIAHTRWATHGIPSVANCHPHTNSKSTISIVHNGIVENHDSLRTQLLARGFKFESQTDTEVIAHLLDDIRNTFAGISLSEAVRLCISQIEGSFGLGVICSDFPNILVGARRGSPLIVGVDKVLCCIVHSFLCHEYKLCCPIDNACIIDSFLISHL